ncbi:MAG: phosphatidylserine decarboxylase [Planctomycetaceae bacterium]|nr:phosphatidylserine decarboxylase [Planctomycetaceae bacterium]
MLIALVVGWFFLVRALSPERPNAVLLWVPEVILIIVLVWVFSFFRDPLRRPVQDDNLLLSPADGTVAMVETLTDCPDFGRPVLRIEIFLSIFNVHINRMPCSVRVGKITYKPGKFLDARSPSCHKLNEANELELYRRSQPTDRMLVRQVSGAVARRIVCRAQTGDDFAGGAQFGMIKFGSCTELYVPACDNLVCRVKKGDKVKAGLTVLAEYKQ